MLTPCIIGVTGFLSIWLPRMPTKSMKTQTSVAFAVPLPSMGLTAYAAHWPLQMFLAYYAVIAMALFLGSLGRGKEIAAKMKVYSLKGENDPESQMGKLFAAQVIVALAVCYTTACLIFPEFWLNS
jgi:hypothetical protein